MYKKVYSPTRIYLCLNCFVLFLKTWKSHLWGKYVCIGAREVHSRVWVRGEEDNGVGLKMGMGVRRRRRIGRLYSLTPHGSKTLELPVNPTCILFSIIKIFNSFIVPFSENSIFISIFGQLMKAKIKFLRWLLVLFSPLKYKTDNCKILVVVEFTATSCRRDNNFSILLFSKLLIMPSSWLLQFLRELQTRQVGFVN